MRSDIDRKRGCISYNESGSERTSESELYKTVSGREATVR